MAQALGLIEALGLSTAMVALDAAVKCADVTLAGTERVIGAGKMISITLCLDGDVAAVQAAVNAGREAGNAVGTILAAHVVPRPHDDLERVFSRFEKRFPPADAPAGKTPKST
jgi:microcompartment protein CcmL/EutN